jgi:hypothetical protein
MMQINGKVAKRVWRPDLGIPRASWEGRRELQHDTLGISQ